MNNTVSDELKEKIFMNVKWLNTTLAGLVLLLWSAAVQADEFEDFIQSCAVIAKNYRTAVAVRESRYGTEYMMHLKTMQEQASVIQQCIRKLNLGQDFSFAVLSGEIEKIFRENKNARIGKKFNVSGNPDGILQVLRFDTKELLGMEFTTEGGGSINPVLERKRSLLEMRRLVHFFQKFRSRINRDARDNRDISLRIVFDNRCKRMLALAQELNLVSMRRNRSSGTTRSLEREIRFLLSCQEKVLDNERRKNASHTGKRRYSGKRKNKGGNINRLRGDETPQALEQNIRISLRNIHDLLQRLDAAGYMPDPALKKGKKNSSQNKNGKDNADPAEVLRGEGQENTSYEAMNRKELNELLLQMRKKILRGNTSIDGFDNETERKYVQTLSRNQLRIYRETLRTLKDQGFESGVAVRNAVLKTQSEIAMKGIVPEKKELVRILEKIRLEKIRRRGQNPF